ncbi:hypothetical protein BDV24DRAFT_107235 [Aspergillus arachidicola]|uniref:Uncharacterized protein n=1 Tax=Aspergillus arachidicola TaxID=656916 RepID=A0A5N6XWZ8_9EURO|nr:hypothetical protein BDV24DRAFT_107235 [Aspergillus arachidicola]
MVGFQDWDVDVYSEDGSIKGTSVEKYYSVVCGSFTKAGFIITPVRIWVSGSKKQGLKKFTWRSTALLLEAGPRISIIKPSGFGTSYKRRLASRQVPWRSSQGSKAGRKGRLVCLYPGRERMSGTLKCIH